MPVFPGTPSRVNQTQAPEPDQTQAPEPDWSLAAGRPLLTCGSADPSVVELTAKLTALGHDCPIGNTVTPDVLVAVNAFRREHDVEDDPDSIPAGHSTQVRENWIGPATWVALLAA